MVAFSAWGAIGLVGIGGGLVLIGVLIGAFCVFKTKHAESGIPFIETPELRKQNKSPQSYARNLFPEYAEDEEESDAAKRIREQKEGFLGGSKENVMDMVHGKRT